MKDRDTSSANQVYLFVNKTQKSKSLSKSDGAVAKQINRHAQHFRSRKVDAEKITSALTSSSSALRIARDGWHKKQSTPSTPGEGDLSQTSNSDNNGSGPAASAAPETPAAATDHNIPVPCVSLTSSLASRTRPWPWPAAAATASISSPAPPVVNGAWDDDGASPDEEADQPDDGENLQLTSVCRANFTAYDCVDPFSATPIQITPKIHSILQYTLRIYPYSGNNFKLAHLPPHVQSTISRFPIKEVVERSVYKEHHLYAIMAGMVARLKHCFDVSIFGDDADELRATASYHLRQELIRAARTGYIDKQTILDILFLVVNEVQYGRYDDARKHLQIVGKLFHLLDQNEHLDRWISETAAHVDNQLALTTATHPVIKRSFQPGPMLPERMATLRREAQRMRLQGVMRPSSVVPRGPKASLGLTDTIADLAETLDVRMGTAFTYGLKVGLYSGATAPIISDLVDCIEIAKVVWLSPLAVCFDAEWLCRKARALLRALVFMAPENNTGPTIVADCTECLRICLLIMMTHACTLVGFHTARTNARRLQKAQEAAFAAWCPAIGWTKDCVPLVPGSRLSMYEHTHAGLALWGTLIGVWSADGLPEQEWFIVRAVNMSRYFGFTTYEDLHNHMVHYLYSSSFQERSLRMVAERLQQCSYLPVWPAA
ncbi:hypothetical protein ABEF95_008855 [Exophiala dermatitidis]